LASDQHPHFRRAGFGEALVPDIIDGLNFIGLSVRISKH
jgi:hypothetical protein